MSFSFLKFEKNINFTETNYCISLEIVKENFITITLRKRHRKMQLGADWCNLVKLCADWCSLVQLGGIWCRLVKLATDWCNLVQLGVDWCNLVQFGADFCRLVEFGATSYRSYKDIVMMNNYHINLKKQSVFKKQLLEEDFETVGNKRVRQIAHNTHPELTNTVKRNKAEHHTKKWKKIKPHLKIISQAIW